VGRAVGPHWILPLSFCLVNVIIAFFLYNEFGPGDFLSSEKSQLKKIG
jgi:hypothetical protein